MNTAISSPGRLVLTVALALATLVTVAAGGAVAQEHSAGPTSTAVENVDQNATYSSIQAAVDNASAGQTLAVSAGTYNESVVVDVPGLAVRGPNAGTPATGNRTSEAVVDTSAGSGSNAAITVTADGVTIDGIQVETATRDGITFTRPVDDVSITNTRITRVEGAVGAKAAGNGIDFIFTTTGQTSDNVTIRDNLVRGVTTPDGASEADAIGIQVLPRGNNVTDLTIADNVIAGIDPGNSTDKQPEGRAISVNTQLVNGTGLVTGLTVRGNEIRNVTGTDVRAIALFESSTTPALGPTNFTITRNSFDNLSASGLLPAAAVYVGAYKNLGASHAFTENDILDGVVTRFADQSNPEQFIRNADALDAVDNWWGDASGPGGAGPGTGQRVLPDPTSPPFSLDDPEVAVEFDPFLKQPVGESFLSIQEAIDRASPGDTVEVPPGVFDESVVVDVPRLTLAAADPTARPVVRGNPAVANSAVNVTADGVTVDGLAVETQTRDGILVSDPVDNVTIENTRIRSVAGSIGGKAAGNGIELFYTGSTQTSSDIVIRNNQISGVTTPDGSVDADAIGVQVLPRGSDIEGLTIADNVITGIDPGNSTGARSDARAISIDTQLVNGSGVVSGLTVTGNSIEDVTGEAVRAIALFESDTDPAVGPTNFTITRNRVGSLDASGGFGAVAFYVGAYKNLGASHAFTENNVLDGSVVRFANASGGIDSAIDFIQDPNTDALNAVGNWWGNTTGPSGAGPGSGQAVVPDPTQFGIQNPEIAVNFGPFRGTPALALGSDTGRLAADTDGDGTYDDFIGLTPGLVTVGDVQTLFNSLGDPAVQDNAQFFDYSGRSPDRVTLLDVQALFERRLA